MIENVRYIRLNITTRAASSATVTQQGLYELRGWKKLIALLFGKPMSEWRNIP